MEEEAGPDLCFRYLEGINEGFGLPILLARGLLFLCCSQPTALDSVVGSHLCTFTAHTAHSRADRATWILSRRAGIRNADSGTRLSNH
jgi:hypothetical protein